MTAPEIGATNAAGVIVAARLKGGLAAVAVVAGYAAQVDRNTGPDDETGLIPAQRCFPVRRQHAGRLAAWSESDRVGVISEELMRSSHNTAETRRTAKTVYSRV